MTTPRSPKARTSIGFARSSSSPQSLRLLASPSPGSSSCSVHLLVRKAGAVGRIPFSSRRRSVGNRRAANAVSNRAGYLSLCRQTYPYAVSRRPARASALIAAMRRKAASRMCCLCSSVIA